MPASGRGVCPPESQVGVNRFGSARSANKETREYLGGRSHLVPAVDVTRIRVEGGCYLLYGPGRCFPLWCSRGKLLVEKVGAKGSCGVGADEKLRGSRFFLPETCSIALQDYRTRPDPHLHFGTDTRLCGEHAAPLGGWLGEARHESSCVFIAFSCWQSPAGEAAGDFVR